MEQVLVGTQQTNIMITALGETSWNRFQVSLIADEINTAHRGEYFSLFMDIPSGKCFFGSGKSFLILITEPFTGRNFSILGNGEFVKNKVDFKCILWILPKT